MSFVTSPPLPVKVAQRPPSHVRILILDNDEDVLLNLERALENEGYTTATAVNYEQAKMLLSQHPFDLLVLDDHLSDRDSIEVVSELRSSELVPPFVVVTYHQHPPHQEQARLWILGVRAVVSKVAHDELTKTVRSLLNSRPSGSSAA